MACLCVRACGCSVNTYLTFSHLNLDSYQSSHLFSEILLRSQIFKKKKYYKIPLIHAQYLSVDSIQRWLLACICGSVVPRAKVGTVCIGVYVLITPWGVRCVCLRVSVWEHVASQ